MSKPTITKLFFGSLFTIVGGLFLAAVGFVLAFGGGTVSVSAGEVTNVEISSGSTPMLLVGAVGVLAIVVGAFGQLVAWLGAVINTARLDDKTWFILLLVLGLLSFGFVPMLVYVIAGPDGTLVTATPRSDPAPAAT